MNKICLIKQPAGIGDIFYLQKFAKLIISSGYKIIWPIEKKLLWIRDYIKEPMIEFISIESQFPNKEWFNSGRFSFQSENFLYLSPDGLQFPGKRIMESKYLLISQDDHDWYDYFQFERNIEKEEDLYYNVLGLKDDSEYVFLNKYANTKNIKYNGLDDLTFDLPTIELEIKEGFTLFDWCKVFENATEIHTVHTSLNYVIDKLDIKSKKYCMYQGNHHSDVQYIPFSKNPTFIPK